MECPIHTYPGLLLIMKDSGKETGRDTKSETYRKKKRERRKGESEYE